jgi:hypothetical protein
LPMQGRKTAQRTMHKTVQPQTHKTVQRTKYPRLATFAWRQGKRPRGLTRLLMRPRTKMSRSLTVALHRRESWAAAHAARVAEVTARVQRAS